MFNIIIIIIIILLMSLTAITTITRDLLVVISTDCCHVVLVCERVYDAVTAITITIFLVIILFLLRLPSFIFCPI